MERIKLLTVYIVEGGAEVAINEEVLEAFDITTEELDLKYDCNTLLKPIQELVDVINPQ